MGQDAGRPIAPQQADPERAKAAVRLQVLGGDPVRLRLQSANPFRGRSAGERFQPGAHARDGGPKVDGGGPGIQQRGRQLLEPEGWRVPGATGKPEHHRVGSRDANGRRPADRHLADRVPNLVRFGALNPRLLGGEAALVQEMEDLAAGVPAEGADHGFTLPAGVRATTCGPANRVPV